MKHFKISIGLIIVGLAAYFAFSRSEPEQLSNSEVDVANHQTPMPDAGVEKKPDVALTKLTQEQKGLPESTKPEQEKTNHLKDTQPDLVKSYPNYFHGEMAAFATDDRYLEAVGDLENSIFNLPSDWSDDSSIKVDQMFKASGRKFVNSETKCNARLCMTTGEVYDEEDFWKIYESLPESTGMAKWGMSYSLRKNDLGNTVFAMYKYRSEEDYQKTN